LTQDRLLFTHVFMVILSFYSGKCQDSTLLKWNLICR